VAWNLVFEFMPTCASTETPQIRSRFADFSISIRPIWFALQTHPNIDHRHWGVELFEARLHDDALLDVPPGALHEDPMHAAAVARCRPVITRSPQISIVWIALAQRQLEGRVSMLISMQKYILIPTSTRRSRVTPLFARQRRHVKRGWRGAT